ncbi:MAG TPA: cyclopropane-fatty-acyl-phospholipid synthase family protein [Pirellulaceae bacterium]|jgi:cyclopropane-fatty-acyl-phospholipid synthase|nr:cyclopropane-fatty-acyl-phospholipid synthase family protein [Pirellulaceae bacterium]
MGLLAWGTEAVERGMVPDAVTRSAIRQLCSKRAEWNARRTVDEREADVRAFVREMTAGPIAPVPDFANRQHYEVPAEFFAAVLGPHRKYSCCEWSGGVQTLEEAERRALETTCRRAELADGQSVLELGCGWGSLSLWMAERYPNSAVTAVSNSHSQRRYIESQARERGLANLSVVTADMNDFAPATSGDFDRVVSVEMFEHMRNYDRLFERISSWLAPDGKLFVHIFCHRTMVYPFETAGEADWMGRHFFTGGIMPSADLVSRFDRCMGLTDQWSWSGEHYRRTAEAWLANFDANARTILPILEKTYGRGDAHRWRNRWRLFFLAVAELFGFRQGTEWYVSHYLLEPVAPRRRQRQDVPVATALPAVSA